MNTYSVHYIQGSGRRDDPVREPASFGGSLGDVVSRMKTMREMVRRSLIHSISVFDVTDGKRVNVTASVVGFDTRPTTDAMVAHGNRVFG